MATTVRATRQKRGWSQIDLATRLGSSQSRIAKVEAGDPSVSLDLMVRALLEVGVTPGDVSNFLVVDRDNTAANLEEFVFDMPYRIQEPGL